jgi:hypothetical protein
MDIYRRAGNRERIFWLGLAPRSWSRIPAAHVYVFKLCNLNHNAPEFLGRPTTTSLLLRRNTVKQSLISRSFSIQVPSLSRMYADVLVGHYNDSDLRASTYVNDSHITT